MRNCHTKNVKNFQISQPLTPTRWRSSPAARVMSFAIGFRCKNTKGAANKRIATDVRAANCHRFSLCAGDALCCVVYDV